MPKSNLLIALSLTFATAAFGQNRIDTWLPERIIVETNSNRVVRQKEAPAGETRSTALVDQSSATEFVSAALSLSPATTGATTPTTGSGGGGAGVVTASVYSLLALANGTDLVDPTFYKAHTTARQISFSVGSTASDKTKDNTEKAGMTVGFKYTIINGREIYSKRNAMKLMGLQMALSTNAAVSARVKAKILIKLFCGHNLAIAGVTNTDREAFCAAPDAPQPTPALAAAFAAFLPGVNVSDAAFATSMSTLPTSYSRDIDSLIKDNLEVLGSLQDTLDATYDEIKKGRQLAIVATYVNRPELGTDDLRGTLTFDYGLSRRINWTVNGSFDHRDRKVGRDTRGGRFATEFLGRLTGGGSDLWGRQPITLSFAGEGKWLTQQKPQYSVQAKLTVPVAAGLDLPIVYRWAKRIDLVDKEGSELKMGLSVDLGNLSQLLKAH